MTTGVFTGPAGLKSMSVLGAAARFAACASCMSRAEVEVVENDLEVLVDLVERPFRGERAEEQHERLAPSGGAGEERNRSRSRSTSAPWRTATSTSGPFGVSNRSPSMSRRWSLSSFCAVLVRARAGTSTARRWSALRSFCAVFDHGDTPRIGPRFLWQLKHLVPSNDLQLPGRVRRPCPRSRRNRTSCLRLFHEMNSTVWTHRLTGAVADELGVRGEEQAPVEVRLVDRRKDWSGAGVPAIIAVVRTLSARGRPNRRRNLGRLRLAVREESLHWARVRRRSAS